MQGLAERRAAVRTGPGRAVLALRWLTLLLVVPLAHAASPGKGSGQAPGASPRASAPDANSPHPEFVAWAEALRSGSNAWLGLAPLRELEQRLRSGKLDPAARFSTLMQLSVLEVREGDTTRGIQHSDEALAILQTLLPRMGSEAARQAIQRDVHRARAVAWMRQAENQNCVRRHTSNSCILPIRADGVHADKEPARQSLASWNRLLALRPDDLEARWFVNLVAMTIGEYPRGVPELHRIDFEVSQSPARIGRFADIAPELGLNRFDLAGGVAIEDFDGDGLLDIVTSTSDPDQGMAFFGRSDDGRFEERSAGSGLEWQPGALNVVATDFDNDRDPDLLVQRGGWLLGDGQVRRSLMRNDGKGRFTDVTRTAGLADPPYPSQAAVWADLDCDGDLDLYVGNEVRSLGGNRVEAFPSQLFRNDGGTFVEVGEAAGVRNDLHAKGVAAGDIDNDGDLDLYVSNIGPNRLYRNDGGMRFREVTARAGVAEPTGRSFVPWFFDFDQDGWLDLWVGGYDATVSDLAADLLGLPHKASPPRLYHNNRDGTFTDIAAAAGVRRPYRPMGANFGDLDGDGWLDIYLGTGDPDYTSLMPNVMLWNDHGRRLLDVTIASGLGHLQKGHGVAFADLDQDGDLDIYHQIGGFFRGDRYGNALFHNDSKRGRFLYLKLVGTRSNRAGLGTRVKVSIETPGGPRELHRAPGSVSSFGGSPLLRQEIGLGDATRVRALEVWWPCSGQRQVLKDIPLDSYIEVREGASSFTTLPLPRKAFVIR